MKIIVPDYYERFACIKGDCRHSCCIGWEIDIDPDSLARFRSVEGELGDRLRRNICENDEGACFRLTEEESCPFLNRDGLCDLILGLGEDCLCQICYDHPRFRNFFTDREEIGLGLCCEAAGKLILGWEGPMRLIAAADDGLCEKLTAEEAEFLEIRDELIAVAQDRSMPVETRLLKMLKWLELEALSVEEPDWISFLLGLERLDESWAERLKNCGQIQFGHVLPEWEIAFEQMMVYLLYRHLPAGFEDGDLCGHIAYAVFAWTLVRSLCAAMDVPDFEELVEICRAYSSELEYSDENTAAIIERLHELNPEL